ncbi:hypothetical protein D3C86_1499910 [compost metagenome]
MQEHQLDRAIGRRRIVDGGDAGIGIAQRRGKTEKLGDAGAINGKAGGGDGGGAHR